ncbi:MAG TPA: sensor histidine kinase [Mycobacteriales bacterium]|nr:sensor histidine kinase [Mycobacteriales bacterium]
MGAVPVPPARSRWDLIRTLRPAVLAVAVLVLGAYGRHEPDRAPVLVALAAVVAGTLGLLGAGPDRLRRPPAPLVLACLLVAGSTVLVWLEPAGAGFLGGFVAASAAGSRLPTRAGAVLTGATLVAFTAAGLAADRPVTSVLIAETGLVAFYSAGRYARRLRERTAEAERLVVELRESRAAQAEAAALAERQRLAREVHDVLAHTLSGLLVQLEGARLVAEQEGSPEQAHGLARSGLQETRRAIGMLRDEQLPGPESLPALVRDFERDTGVPCRLDVSGTPRPYGPQARLALYRVAQEALTNVRRHAAAQRVELAIDHSPAGARLTVQDVGVSAAPAGAGYGLTGMRERAELLGGTLTATATDRGFRVELWVPP